MNKITINQLINWVQEFSQAHAQINSMGFGMADQIGNRDCMYNIAADKGRVTYPNLWVTLSRPTYTRRTVTYILSILIHDKVEDNEFNELDCFSDCDLIMRDFLAWLVNKQSHIDNINIDNNYTTQNGAFYEYKSVDFTAGVVVDLNINVINTNDVCAIPTILPLP